MKMKTPSITTALAFTAALFVHGAAFAGPQTTTTPATAEPIKPSKVTKKDTKGIDALYAAMKEATGKGDVNAGAANIDFPVFISSAKTPGTVGGKMFTKEEWLALMKPADPAAAKTTDAKTPEPKTTQTHKVVSWINNDMAVAEEGHVMTVGKKKVEWTSTSLLVKKDGKWMIKSIADGGGGPETQSNGLCCLFRVACCCCRE